MIHRLISARLSQLISLPQQVVTSLAIWLCLSPGSLQAAPPTFVVEDSLQFTFPLPESPASGLSFWLGAKDGSIADVKVRVKQIKNPRGQLLAFAAVAVDPPEIKEVTEEGAAVTLKPDAAQFALPGDYQILLFAQGTANKAAVPLATIKVVIHCPAAEINLDELKDRTLYLTRSGPGGKASANISLNLRETTNLARITQLTTAAQALLTKEGKAQAPGTVTAIPESTTIPAGGQTDIRLEFKDCGWTGSYVTQVTVTSPSLGTPKVIPLNILVTDPWGWALLTIAVGVVGGFLTHFLAETWRPKRVNLLMLVRLKGEVDRFRTRVESDTKLVALSALTDQLREAEQKNDIGETAAAKTQLDAIAGKVDEFRKTEAKAKADARLKLDGLQSGIELYRQKLSTAPTPAESDFFNASPGRFDEIGNLLRTDQIDSANRKLEALQREFNGLRLLALGRDLENLRQRLNDLQVAQGADKTPIANKINEVQGLLDDPTKIDEIEKSLKKIRQDIQGLPSAGPRGGRPEPAPRSLSFEATAQAEAQARNGPRLLIETEPRFCLTESPIAFSVENLSIGNGDKVRWSFGDGSPTQETTSLQAAHEFREPNEYLVQFQQFRDNGATLVNTLAVHLNVLPSRAQQKIASINMEILVANALFSATSLVLACLTGVLALYVGKTFGSLSDYLLALLWGFGLDNSIRGFAAISKKISSPGA